MQESDILRHQKANQDQAARIETLGIENKDLKGDIKRFRNENRRLNDELGKFERLVYGKSQRKSKTLRSPRRSPKRSPRK